MSRFTDIFSKKDARMDITDSSQNQFYPLEFNTRETKDLSRGDYLRLYTGWAYVACSTISQSLASLEKHLVKDIRSTDVVSHEYMDLITYDFLLKVVSYMQLNGSCFVWKMTFPWSKKIQALEVLRPDLIQFKEDTNGVLQWYTYTANWKSMSFTKDEVIAFHNFNPLQAFPFNIKWVSPMQAVAMQMEMDVTANKWNRNFFRNGWTVKDVISTEKVLDPIVKKRFITDWKSEFRGVNNAHKVAVLDWWLSFSNVSPSQKEMDFVESRRFTRDEVFGIFKVPKIIAWMSEDFNKATAQVANFIFMEKCILPIATQIQEQLNKEIFNWIGYFEFINVVPVDVEQLDRDFNNGAITLNEYREMKWYKKIVDWDTLKQWFGEPIQVQYEKVKESKASENTVSIVEKAVEKAFPTKEKALEMAVKSTFDIVKWLKLNKEHDEYWQKIREAKIARTWKFEWKYVQAMKHIRAEQERDLLKEVQKWITNTKSLKDNWNTMKYVTMRLSAFGPMQKDLIISEANQALALVWIETFFRPWTDKLDKYMRNNITKFAKEVDMVTKEKMFDIIDKWNNEWLSVQDITKNIAWEFQEFWRTRANVIARTEVTRASNRATETAREQSWKVNKKEWFTSRDERVCEFCWPMNWKTVSLWENFFEKWHTLVWSDGSRLKLDYESIKTPSLHPNCRCTLLPVIE